MAYLRRKEAAPVSAGGFYDSATSWSRTGLVPTFRSSWTNRENLSRELRKRARPRIWPA